MIATTVLLAALVSVLALVTLGVAVALRRTSGALGSVRAGLVTASDARDRRVVDSLARARAASLGFRAGTERALWAVERFDGRSHSFHAQMRGRRAQLDETRTLITGMGGKLQKVRNVISFVAGA